MNKQHQALLLLHSAILMFGGTALCARVIPLPALDITVLRCIISAVVLALGMTLTGHRIRLHSHRDYGYAMLLGAIVGVHWFTYFMSLKLAGVAISMVAFFTYPIMVVLAEPMLQGKRPQRADLISALVVLLGIILVIPEYTFANNITLGILIAIISAVLFTVRNLLQKRVFSQYSGAQTMFYQTLVASIVLIPFMSAAPLTMPSSGWLLTMILAVFFTATPHAMLAGSLRTLKAKTVGLVSCLQPFYGTVLAALILAEWPTLKTIIGGLLIVTTALVETWRTHEQNT